MTLTIIAPANRRLQSRFGSDRRSGRLKAELLEGGCFLSVDDARTEVFEYIECYYNRQGRLNGAKALVAGLQKP